MNLYEMNGDSAMVFHDTKISSIPELRTSGLGLQSALKYGASVAQRASAQVTHFTGKRLDSFVYLLTPEESKFAIPLMKNTSVRLWVNGQGVDAAVISKETLSPGGNGKLVIEASAAVSAAKGARFFLERDGRVIAMGVLVDIAANDP